MKNINKILTTLSLSASDTREDTIMSIITSTLLEGKEPVPLKTLKENIGLTFDLQLYENEFKMILSNLIENDRIELNNGLYSLKDDEKKKLIVDESILKSSELVRFQNFKNFIDETSKSTIVNEDIKLLWNTFKNYLYGCFFQYGIKANEFLHPSYKNADSVNLNNGEVFNEAIKNLPKIELANTFKIIVDSFPEYATKEDLDFIDGLGQKTLCFASLGLSPEQAKEDIDKELIDWVLYLDTNFLFSILDLHSNTENESCKELLKLIFLNQGIIKIKFRYSELTLKELRNKKSDFKNLDETLTDSAIKAILKSNELDEFSKKYYNDLLNNRADTIHPSQVIDVAEITLPKQGIEISRNSRQIEALGEAFINAKITEYERYIADVNSYREEYFKKNHISNFRPSYRSVSQMNHDIVLRELIISSRRMFKKDEIQTFNEVKYFGVTLDDLLMKFDNYKIKKAETTTYPTFFRPSLLLNKLVKLLPVKTENYKKAFIKAVSSRGFNKDAQKSDDIIKIASYLKRFGIDNEEVLLNFISEKLFLEKFHQENSKSDFNSEKFFESELNILLADKEKEISESKSMLKELRGISEKEKEEKEKIKEQKEKKEQEVTLLASAISQLHNKVKILEDRPPFTVPPTFNFDAANKQKEVDELRIKLEEANKINNAHENARRKPLREAYIKTKVSRWRFWPRIYILICFILLSGVVAYICLLGDWKNDGFATVYQNSRRGFIASVLVSVIILITGSFFIKRFSDQFSESNLNSFKQKIEKELPNELKEIED